MRLRLTAPLLFFLLFSFGCSHKVETVHNPEYENIIIKSIYLEKLEGDNLFHVYRDIKDELDLLGYDVKLGSSSEDSFSYDAKMKYIDKWMWDMSNYLLKLDMFLIHTRDLSSISETSVMRTSLIRKSKKNMVREALSELFFADEEKDIYMKKKVRYNGLDIFDRIYFKNESGNKSYIDLIVDFYKEKNIDITLGDLTYPDSEIDYIGEIYSVYGNKYFQIRARDSSRLVAEVYIENLNDKESKELSSFNKRLDDLHSLLEANKRTSSI